jgi:hypothetical protein
MYVFFAMHLFDCTEQIIRNVETYQAIDPDPK